MYHRPVLPTPSSERLRGTRQAAPEGPTSLVVAERLGNVAKPEHAVDHWPQSMQRDRAVHRDELPATADRDAADGADEPLSALGLSGVASVARRPTRLMWPSAATEAMEFASVPSRRPRPRDRRPRPQVSSRTACQSGTAR